jgi:TPR repeat protein
MYGMGVAKDEAEGVRWYRKAAEQGHAWAQFHLGLAYKNGNGVAANVALRSRWRLAKDEAEGVRWIRKAADQGYASAQYKLGRAYMNDIWVVAKD